LPISLKGIIFLIPQMDKNNAAPLCLKRGPDPGVFLTIDNITHLHRERYSQWFMHGKSVSVFSRAAHFFLSPGDQ
jgi:hypothetical protein